MIIREKYLKAIRGFYDSDLIKVITGIRRSGKSVILETIINEIKEKGVDVYIAPKLDNKIDLNFVVEKLGELKIDSVLVEGGATLNDSLFRNNLVDKVKIFIAPKIIGGKNAPSFVSGEGIEKLSDATKLKFQNITMVDGDILIEADVIK